MDDIETMAKQVSFDLSELADQIETQEKEAEQTRYKLECTQHAARELCKLLGVSSY